MPLLHAFYLCVVVLAVAAATARGRLHPVLAMLLAAAGFAALSSMSIGQLGKVFGTGFSQALNNLGLPVLAASAVTVLAAHSGAAEGLARATTLWPGRLRAAVLALIGVVAGTGAVPAASFAVLAPLRAALDGAGGRRRGALTVGLAISAGQAFLMPSPVLIAAAAILGAGWGRVIGFGVPLAGLTAAAGAWFASRVASDGGAAAAPASGAARGAGGLVLACVAMAALLAVQSLGDIPSEPFGGGSTREFILGAGRPLILLLVGGAIMVAAAGAWRGGALSETGWIPVAIARAAPLMLLLGAAGGLQSLDQARHMAELAAERWLPLPWGLAVPFLAAATMKAMQGSPLVAAITAAGMVQPLLAVLGLDGETGRALAVLAIGAGAMTASHVNDGLFWVVADEAGLRPPGALALVSGGTLLQGALALASLLALHSAWPGG
jgi:gluconate:H+ symporter, GntP family